MVNETRSKPVVFMVRNLPRGLRQRFKTYCVKRSYTMNDAMEALMRKAIKEDMELDV